MAKITVVVGGQYGSEGKGAICGFLGKSMGADDMAVRVAGPNAGHTVIGKNGEVWKLRSLPVAAVTSADCQLHIAPGSEIDVPVLMDEVNRLVEAGYDVNSRLSISPHATLITSRHQEEERGLVATIGSTGKGIGGARADRIMRRAELAFADERLSPWIGPDENWFDLADMGQVVIEGTQGYGLGLHTVNYPQVTSSNCRAIDFLSMAGLSPWHDAVRATQVYVVARAFPIRVAGNSGPLKGETTWAELGLAEERTTVTNKVRRVGQWDGDLVRRAIAENGGGGYNPHVHLALTMLDHRFPDHAHKADLDAHVEEWVDELEGDLETHITLVGTGPDTVVER